jgi:hypothetical protein
MRTRQSRTLVVGIPRRFASLPAALSIAATAAVACADHSGPSRAESDETAASSYASAVLIGAGDVAGCNRLSGDHLTAEILARTLGTVFTLSGNVYDDATAVAHSDCYHASWGRHRARTRPAPGNHEYNSPGARPYYRYFGSRAGPSGKGYYSYNLGAWHIVSLNSQVLSSAQEGWLRADLARNRAKCVLAYWQHPLFTSGHHPPATRMRALFRLLYDAGAEVVLNAHNHQYERFAPQSPNGVRTRPAGSVSSWSAPAAPPICIPSGRSSATARSAGTGDTVCLS